MRREDLWPVAALTAAFWGAALLLPAWPGAPVNDDWAYAETAYRLAREGTLRLSDWGTPNLVVQAAWGALFCRLFGEGPAALRLSTLVLAWLGGLAFYALAKRLKLPRPAELAALLLFSPLYLVLSASFMTDVPALALGLIGLALAAGGGVRDLAAGSLFFALAYGVRQTMLAFPAGLTLWLWRQGRLSPPRAAALWALPLLAAAAHGLWYHGVHGATLNRFPLAFDPLTLLRRLAAGCVYAGLFALPLTAASWFDRPLARLEALPRWRWVLVALPLLSYGPDVHQVCSYVSPAGLGCWNIEGVSSRFDARWLLPALMGAAYLSWLVLVARAAAAALLAPLVLAALAALPAASFFDRYWLPLAPAVLLAGAALPRSRAAAAAFCLVVWAAAADYARSTQAAWSLGERAVAAGLAPEEVKASVDWCWAKQWPAEAERFKAAGRSDLQDVPMTCLHVPRAVVSFRAKLKEPKPVLAQAEFFSPLLLRRERLFLYQAR